MIEIVGTSSESWEKTIGTAIERSGARLRNLRVGEVTKLDVTIKAGKVDNYRARIHVSFKYEG